MRSGPASRALIPAPLPADHQAPRRRAPPAGPSARIVLAMLEKMSWGRLRLITPDGRHLQFGDPASSLPEASLVIHRWRALSRALHRGDVGFGEAFMDGDWSTSDLTHLLITLVQNRAALGSTIEGRPLLLLMDRLVRMLRRNTPRQARRNIAAHYDLGNDFYQLWLDPTMTYSSGLFAEEGLTSDDAELLAAQNRKMDRALGLLGPLGPESRTLEIGCGWGGLTQRRLAQPGHHVGITLSTEQKAWAERLLGQAGLNERCEIRLQDYRDLEGVFDGIVSVEMIEAVGESFWPDYFQTLQRCLKPGGRAVIQAIVIREDLFADYRKGLDFIQKYIFPGGMLLTPSAITAGGQSVGLHQVDSFCFGAHYGRTLRAWLDRFNAQEEAVRGLGFDDRFLAMWRFYLAYCEAGFASGDLDVVQVCLEKPCP